MPLSMTTNIHPNLIIEQTTSISANQLTAPAKNVSFNSCDLFANAQSSIVKHLPILTRMITTQKMVIQAAMGTAFVQNPSTVFIA